MVILWLMMINNDLVGGLHHLEKYESQWEGLSHILWKINMFETTNRISFKILNSQDSLFSIYLFGRLRVLWIIRRGPPSRFTLHVCCCGPHVCRKYHYSSTEGFLSHGGSPSHHGCLNTKSWPSITQIWFGVPPFSETQVRSKLKLMP